MVALRKILDITIDFNGYSWKILDISIEPIFSTIAHVYLAVEPAKDPGGQDNLSSYQGNPQV